MRLYEHGGKLFQVKREIPHHNFIKNGSVGPRDRDIGRSSLYHVANNFVTDITKTAPSLRNVEKRSAPGDSQFLERGCGSEEDGGEVRPERVSTRPVRRGPQGRGDREMSWPENLNKPGIKKTI